MAFKQYFSHGWKHAPAAVANSERLKACFDCNICLELPSEPVITLCGHLYCWPCIYQWFHVQSASLDSQQCPVCKVEISLSTMVPLYGSGQSTEDVEIDGNAMVIPPRPLACDNKALASIRSNACDQQLLYPNPYQNPNYSLDTYDSYYEDESGVSLLNLESDPFSTIGMFGGMVYARVFGNSEGLNAYPNSYGQSGSSNPRARRQEMQADKSLNRVSFFLLCCLVVCLIFF